LTAHLLASERAMLDKLPNAGQHLNGYAWVCARTGRDLAEGEKLVRQAIEQMPDWSAYIDTLAVILHRKGDLEGAIEQARRCVELDPNDVHFRYQLGTWQREKREKR
jgi:Flp pilus assembly protein TadD